MKLVRDGIPELAGRTYEVAVDDTEYRWLLFDKLKEELDEVAIAASADIHSDAPDHLAEELGDLIEVCLCIGLLHGITPETIERMRTVKSAERGSFTGRRVI